MFQIQLKGIWIYYFARRLNGVISWFCFDVNGISRKKGRVILQGKRSYEIFFWKNSGETPVNLRNASWKAVELLKPVFR